MDAIVDPSPIDADTDPATSKVLVSDLVGQEVLLFGPPPPKSVAELKVAIKEKHGTPVALQRLICGDQLLSDGDAFSEIEDSLVTFVVDETPLYSWDISGNPLQASIAGDGGHVRYPEPYKVDYIHVMTQEAVQKGVHYFEFVMHRIGDEQWCGVVPDKQQAGNPVHPYHLKGWVYYCGRRYSTEGALQYCTELGKVHRDTRVVSVKSHDIIGMVVNLDVGVVAFAVNGVVQGSLQVPKIPLHLVTLLDSAEDHVELRKPPLSEAPENLVAASNTIPDKGHRDSPECLTNGCESSHSSNESD